MEREVKNWRGGRKREREREGAWERRLRARDLLAAEGGADGGAADGVVDPLRDEMDAGAMLRGVRLCGRMSGTVRVCGEGLRGL